MTESWDAHTHQVALDALLNEGRGAPQFGAPPERAPPQQRGTQGVAHMKEKKEREQKERRRQELTAEKAEKEKRRQDALRQLEIWSESDNLLKRPSEFICKMKFFNTLPDPPADSKLLDIQWPLERLYQYAPTSLERDYQHDVLLDTTLGIVVDMVTPSAYMLPEGAVPKLAPEDEALLVAEKETLAGKDRRGARKKAISVPWLRKSEFITAVFDENLYNQSTTMQTDVVRAAHTKSHKGAADAKEAFAHLGVEAVNRQFERTQSEPVHPRNPALTPVSVEYVVPNYDYLSNALVHVLYEQVPPTERDAKQEREQSLLVMHQYTDKAPKEGEKQKIWLTRVLPNERDDVDDLFGGAEEAAQVEPEYHLAGTYAQNFAPQTAKGDCWEVGGFFFCVKTHSLHFRWQVPADLGRLKRRSDRHVHPVLRQNGAARPLA
jgi:hypothetical protein